jgi:hypothetical protein
MSTLLVSSYIKNLAKTIRKPAGLVLAIDLANSAVVKSDLVFALSQGHRTGVADAGYRSGVADAGS